MHSHLITLLGFATAAFADTIDVKVGNGGLTFDPDSFTANEGDSVRFHFYSGFGSHSVALSSFDTPCQPATDGFYSGIIQGNQAGDHTFTINITSTSPSWIYCSVGSHCQSGMVAVINPPSGQTISAYRSAAENALRQSSPGDVQGGVIATGGTDTGSSPSTTPSPASPRPSATVTSETVPSSVTVTTGAGGSTVPVSTTSSSASGSGTVSRSSAGSAVSTTTSPSGTPASTSPSVAATTTSGGRKSEWSIVLGLSVILGGWLL
ncbi:Cupredoxin [Rhexocercosporidium sp. MPI-PUGE-AT-0058]|nr:Cupredoxin [Rhexocercosporidium sp. MPI-PUGE-AT-0058]